MNFVVKDIKASAAAETFLARKHHKMLVNGNWVPAMAGETIDTVNPATGVVIGDFPAAQVEDVNEAVRSARAALEEGQWSKCTPRDRERLMWRLADLIEANMTELAELETIDQGKPLYVANTEVHILIQDLRFYAGLCTKIQGETFTTSIDYLPGNTDTFAYTVKEPVGVVGAIVPWNSPLIMAGFKLGPALATGCTVILKPAENTSLTAIRLGELVMEAGFPPGVVNVVTGYGHQAGNALAAHMDVDKIAFTGSTRTGRSIIDAAKGNLKRVTLELGGKSPAIFFDDCNMNIAIAGAANAVTWNSGQICVAGSRLYAHKSIFDRMVAGVSEILGSMPLGNGLDPNTAIGPMVSALQADSIDGFIQRGIEAGAEAVVGGGKADAAGGCFIKPTVLVNTQPNMQCVKEEIFGPVLVCMPFDDVDEVIRQANNSIYGLSASIWTENHSKAIRLSRRLKVGTVWVNSHLLFDEAVPIGGYKQSGFGRDRGAQAIENYMETKTVFAAIQ